MNRMTLRFACLLLAAGGLLTSSTLQAQTAAVPALAAKTEAAPISEWQKQQNERMLLNLLRIYQKDFKQSLEIEAKNFLEVNAKGFPLLGRFSERPRF